jgi:hypothetical protein
MLYFTNNLRRMGRRDELALRKYLTESAHDLALPPRMKVKVDLVD